MTEKLIEAVARAIAARILLKQAEELGVGATPDEVAAVNRSLDRYWPQCEPDARAAIAAIEASGTHRVVPYKPTEAMRAQGEAALVSHSTDDWSARNVCFFIYANMYAAAPKVIE